MKRFISIMLFVVFSFAAIGQKMPSEMSAATVNAFRLALGINNVENTALSTYTGSGGALDNQYIANGAGYAVLADIDTESEFEAALFAITTPSELTVALGGYVPNNRTVNGQALSSNIVLDPDDLDDTSTTNKFVSAAEKSAWDAKLSDAPNDGNQYARKDGAWAQVVASGGSGLDPVQSLAYSATPTWDVSASNNRTMTLTGNVTSLTLTNIDDGELFQIEITQDATGGYGITDFVYSGGTIIYYPGVQPLGSNIESSANQSTIIAGVRYGTNIHINFKHVEPESLPRTAEINVQTGTTYTILESDNGKWITFNNASAITVTLPSGLPVGFNCSLKQKGAGQVSISTSGTTLENRNSHTSLAGQFAVATLLSDETDVFTFQGDTQ